MKNTIKSKIDFMEIKILWTLGNVLGKIGDKFSKK